MLATRWKRTRLRSVISSPFAACPLAVSGYPQTASGQAALHLAIATLAGAGSHVVASRALYGGSHNLLDYTLPRFGITTTFVDPRDLDAWRAAIRPETRLLFGETLGNPGLDVLDIPTVAEIAHAHRVPLLVDSTFTTPYLIRPGELGADLVYHSATKFLCGHGTVVGGLLVDIGRFDWEASGRFPELTEPYAGFHGMVFSEESTVAPFLLRARREGLRDFGACLSPMNAFQILQGIETLALRMDRICSNTLTVAKYLQQHDKVAWVNYAGLPDHADHGLVQKYMGGHASGILSFGVKGEGDTGGIEAGSRFQDALQLILRLVNIGDAKSLACHPASTTHRQLSPAEMAKAGVTPDMVRLSIGIEHVDDLIADLDQALAQV